MEVRYVHEFALLPKDRHLLTSQARNRAYGGGTVSSMLANIYLHFAVDLWFEEAVMARCQGLSGQQMPAIICLNNHHHFSMPIR